MLEPLQVDVAADVVAQNQIGLRNGGERRLAIRKIHSDIGLDVSAIIGGVSHLLGLQDQRQRLLLHRQLQGIDLGIDRNHVEGLDQLHGIAADHHVDGLASLAFRGRGEAVVIPADHVFLEIVDPPLIIVFAAACAMINSFVDLPF